MTCNAVVEKNAKARLKWIKTNNPKDRNEYDEKRKESNKIIRKKREWMDNKIREIEREKSRGNTKSFYKKINENNKTYKGKTKGIKNKEGRMTEEEHQYKQTWVDHFRELLIEPHY